MVTITRIFLFGVILETYRNKENVNRVIISINISTLESSLPLFLDPDLLYGVIPIL